MAKKLKDINYRESGISTDLRKINVGRPTKYRPEMCARIPFYFKEGASIEEVALKLGITRSSYYNWKEIHPEFNHAAELGEQVAAVYLQKVAYQIAIGEIEASPAMMIFILKNRLGWRDKSDFNPTRSIQVIVDPEDLEV